MQRWGDTAGSLAFLLLCQSAASFHMKCARPWSLARLDCWWEHMHQLLQTSPAAATAEHSAQSMHPLQGRGLQHNGTILRSRLCCTTCIVQLMCGTRCAD
ncbi:hypothetical protein COO60DRAFT_1539997 [Scenedesmus sp. NREL 46B-D3]|nr:hypothetical protein COO60DRAFT_1539997 [Scenedesmus sp. NREL 46B-D3]